MNLPPDFVHELKDATTCDVRTDASTRWLYSTDASIYQIEPYGVAFPRTLDDLTTAVALAAQAQVPILARGAGSSLAGQAIGPALILDCARYLTKLQDVEVYRENGRVTGGAVTAEPGIVLNALNKAVSKEGLQFGPDPASAERATLGGSLANNATGAHSILYGMSADHLLSVEVILADGSVTKFEEQSGNGITAVGDLEKGIYAAAKLIREKYATAIQARWPRVWRRASGYNLNYLLPWTPAIPSGWRPEYNPESIYNIPEKYQSDAPINLAPLLAGSEGTLAVIRRATIRLVPLPRHTILGVMSFTSLPEACDVVPDLLARHKPSAVELIPQLLIKLARSVPAYAAQLSWVNQLHATDSDPAALLVVEFSGDDPAVLRKQVEALGPNVLIADTSTMQKQIWAVRKVGLGILQSRPGAMKPATFIEDFAVPVDRLGEYVREMNRIMAQHNTVGEFYAHASAGCLHFRPILNVKSPEFRKEMRGIAEEAVDLVLRLGGTPSGEHGDGLSRSEWLERAYGPEIVSAFCELKTAADPQGILNPGKIIDPPKMDTNLRLKITADLAWKPFIDFRRNGGAPGPDGLIGAIEMCNGAGVCRKVEGVMCPSFQATREEAYSTRGRSSLLRSIMVSPQGLADNWLHTVEGAGQLQKAWEALDLCLACKGCKSECPSGVDMAKLKYEFMHHYYTNHTRRLRDYLFAYIGVIAPFGALAAPLVNWVMRQPLLRRSLEKYFGLSCQRPFPQFAPHSAVKSIVSGPNQTENPASTVLFLRDTFNHYFYPEVEKAALQVLAAVNVKALILPIMGTGRTLISKGFLPAAKKHADRLRKFIQDLDPEGQYPIIGLEPSEIYTIQEEYLDFYPQDEKMVQAGDRAWMIDEYLIRINNDQLPKAVPGKPKKVYLHSHCYQKSRPPAADGLPTGTGATAALLRLAGYSVEVLDDGCCGMAGAFGYEAEHYDVSMKVGGLVLFPTLQAAKQTGNDSLVVAAPGVSCRAQIEDGTGLVPCHPIQLISNLLQ